MTVNKIFKTIKSSIVKKNYLKITFYITMLLGISLFLFTNLLTRGSNHFNLLFIPAQNDFFMDFFNVLQSLYIGPYTLGFIYPPFALLIYKLLLRFVPFDIAATSPGIIRGTQSGELVFLFYTLISLFLFFLIINEIKKGIKIEKYLFTITLLFSAPFLNLFERGNIIFIALIFLAIFVFFKDSKNRIVREFSIISLAISGAIKIYPLIFLFFLLKEKRFNDFYKLVFYSFLLFLVPFLFLGGFNQIFKLIENFSYTSSEAAKWGFGYTVNIQNLTRIFFAFLGNFGDNPIIIGRVMSILFLILGIFASFLSRSFWKAVAILTLLIILVPNISYVYTLVFMIIPLILFLDKEKKEKWDKLYLLCFLLLLLPFPYDNGVEILNRGFHLKQFLPVTYSILVQNIIAFSMLFILILETLSKNKKQLEILFTKLIKFKYYVLIPLTIIFIYNITFFNKYVPITEGWFSTYAYLFNHGHFIYKDFYMFLTPLYTIIISLFTSIVGYDILYLRIFGIGVMLLITFFLYKNLEILFGKSISSFVTTIGVIYYQSGVAHITYDFTQFVALFGLIQAYCLLSFLRQKENKNYLSVKWLVLAGFFASFTFLIKQSNGLMMALFPIAGLIVLSIKQKRHDLIKIIAYYVLGFALPILAIFAWLISNSAFWQFKEQVFSDAISAKGGFYQILTGWIKENFKLDFLIRLIEILAVLGVFGYWLNFFKFKNQVNKSFNSILLLLGSGCLFIIILITFMGKIYFLNNHFRFAEIGIPNLTVSAVSFSLAIVIGFIIFTFFKKPINKSLVMLAFISLGYIFGTGTSAGLSEVAAFIGLCMFIGYMLKLNSFLNLGKVFIILFCLSLSFVYVEIKYERPYYWWGLSTLDIRINRQIIKAPSELNGLYTSENNLKLINDVSAAISTYSKASDSVVAFPNIPLFYLINNRWPPGKAVVYWFDFLPDNLAIKEAEAIKKNPPKVIVYLDLGPAVWQAHEALFRNGKSSGQRAINDSIKAVIKKQKMLLLKTYNLENNNSLSVYVSTGV